MSFQALNWAKGKARTPSGNLILLLLAERADEEHSCFPGQETLAAESGLGVRQVRRVINQLEADDLLHRSARNRGSGGGRGRTSDRYFLHIDQPDIHVLLDDTTNRTSEHDQPDICDTTNRTPMSGPIEEPPDEPPVEPKRPRATGDSTFDEIWGTWPNQRSGRQPAVNAWKRTRREHGGRLNDLIAACICYRDHHQGNQFAKGLPKFLGDQYEPGEWLDWVDGTPDWAPTDHIESEKEVLTMEDLIAFEANETGTA